VRRRGHLVARALLLFRGLIRSRAFGFSHS
jgi:hypothetical protein